MSCWADPIPIGKSAKRFSSTGFYAAWSAGMKLRRYPQRASGRRTRQHRTYNVRPDGPGYRRFSSTETNTMDHSLSVKYVLYAHLGYQEKEDFQVWTDDTEWKDPESDRVAEAEATKAKRKMIGTSELDVVPYL